MASLFNFNFLNDQLLNMGAVHSASELQGLLCGLLSAGAAPTDETWRKDSLEFLDLEYIEPTVEQSAVFELILKESMAAIADDQYRFLPLLPDDDASLTRRAQELGAWCGGYLHGLGKVLGGKEDKKLSSEVADAMRDLASITQIGVDEDDPDGESEAHWIELVEYVKVAVLTIYNELKPTVH